MGKEPSQDVMTKLEKAVSARQAAQGAKAAIAPPQPRQPKQPTILAAQGGGQAPAAGSNTATYLLVDHFFGGAYGTFWAYDGSQWRAAGTNEPADEQGVAQVAFASNRVDIYWDNNDALTIARCWKYL